MHNFADELQREFNQTPRQDDLIVIGGRQCQGQKGRSTQQRNHLTTWYWGNKCERREAPGFQSRK